MSLITLKGSVSGTRNGTEWPPRGSTIDLPDDEAAALVASGMAVKADKGADVTPFDAAPDHAAVVNAATVAAGRVETAAVNTSGAKRA